MINGLDRLIMELKLPPTDAYHKFLGSGESGRLSMMFHVFFFFNGFSINIYYNMYRLSVSFGRGVHGFSSTFQGFPKLSYGSWVFTLRSTLKGKKRWCVFLCYSTNLRGVEVVPVLIFKATRQVSEV